MTQAASLATLRDIRKRAQDAPMAAVQTLSGSALTGAFGRSVRAAILPRRITLRTADGAHLAVLAKSRRVIKVLEASPGGLWAGEDDLDWRDCNFAIQATLDALANTVDRMASRGETRIETGLPMPKAADDTPPRGAQTARAFYDAHQGYARGFAGDAVEIDLPSGSRIGEAWLRKLLDSVRSISDAAGPRSRILKTEGDAPVMLAEIICESGDVVLVVAEDAAGCAALERSALNMEGAHG